MARKFLFLLFCLFAAVGLTITACEVDGDGDADGTTSGTSGNDATTSGVTDTSGGTSGGTVLNYYFVRVNDQSTNTGNTNPGADIDAIGIVKPDGTRHYVSKVEQYSPVNVDDIAALSAIPDNIIGAPTAFADPTNVSPASDCSLEDQNFVALGGVGGYIIVSFGDAHVENGDTLNVYEIGNCANGGVADPVEVQVSVASNADGEWVTVFSALAGPLMSSTVSGLPVKTN